MKILNKLTIKHLKSNKKRTIVTIIGIILSTALMVGIGLLFSTIRDNSLKNVIEMNGNHHVEIRIPESKLEQITDNDNIKNYKYKSTLGYAKPEKIAISYKPYIQIQTASDNFFKEIELLEGRLPQNNHELIITKDLLENNDIELKLNDKINLSYGDRTSDGIDLYDTPIVYEEKIDEDGNYTYTLNEELINLKNQEYTIVGIIKEDYLSSRNAGYSAYTLEKNLQNINVYIEYTNPNKTYDYTQKIASSLGYKPVAENLYNEIKYNDSLLMMYGVSNYDNIFSSVTNIIIIILSLISIACIIVIYNSFAISVMERKKQFGLFSSIGATRKQLKYTVFFEALIVGLIGIPLGIASAYLGIGIVLMIINKLLPNFLGLPLTLATYPIFIIIPIIFMIITILISAYLPAKRASKVSPIEAIRLNDEIKIKSKKLKTPKIITKLFGIEGEIAYKNMKRNKKKYRITIISLFISIVLFVSFSGLLKYGLKSSGDFTEMPRHEYEISINSKLEDKKYLDEIVKKIEQVEGIKQMTIINSIGLTTEYKENYYQKDSKIQPESLINNQLNVTIHKLDSTSYKQYKKELGLNENDNRPILLNINKSIDYSNGERKQKVIKPFNKITSLELNYYDYKNDKPDSTKFKLENIFITDILPFGIENTSFTSMTFIVDEKTFDTIDSYKIYDEQIYDANIYIKGDNYGELDKMLDKDNKDNILNDKVHVYNWNIIKEMKTLYNAILVVKILLYGFISLVTLIGITSVINTINTSIALRKKEFAVLRSIGLTPQGFNKMLLFECFLFGFKSLLYALPVSFGIIYLFHMSFGGLVTLDKIILPYNSIIIAIVGVFVIVLITMWYATSKIKKENILDAIREENI